MLKHLVTRLNWALKKATELPTPASRDMQLSKDFEKEI